MPVHLFFSLTIALSVSLASAAEIPAGGLLYRPSLLSPPRLPREFRGVWIATVGNIDWPSRPGLSSDVQQSEFIRLLDRAVSLKLNAVILQVRPASDALVRFVDRTVVGVSVR